MSSMISTPRIMAPDSPRYKTSKVVEWHFDFLLPIGQILNGQTLVFDLLIPPGAPFCLRGIGGYNITPGEMAPPDVTPLTDAFLQFSDSTDNFLQTQLIGTSGDWATGGVDALYEPVYNQVVYAPNSAMQVRVRNGSGATYANAFLVFRGAKLYYRDLMYNPSYPERYNALPYEFPVQWPPNPLGNGLITIPASTTLRDVRLQVTGADFVLRGGVVRPISGSIADVRFILRDQWGRPYSNDFIHYNWLFSQDLAQRPGVFYPEIYLPKDRMLLMDIQQNEATGEASVFQLNFNGQRVFPK